MIEFGTIIAGIGAGITYSLTSFVKKAGQKFSFLKFGRTVIIGGLAGLTMVFFNIQIDLGYLYAIQLGLIPVVENLLQAFYYKVIKKIFK